MLLWAQGLDQTATPLLPTQQGWTWFLTSTFRHPIPPHHALTASRRLTTWSKAWHGTSSARGSTFRLLLWSAESHKSGNVHLHALSVCTPGAFLKHCPRCQDRVSSLRTDWRKLKESLYIHHGLARVYRYDPTLTCGAVGYVLKYILSRNCLDWGVWTA